VASILDCVVQPVWVVDQAGLIRLANPSAIGALNGNMDIATPAAGGTVLRARIPLAHDWAGDAGVVL
jgi:hypothetical protein